MPTLKLGVCCSLTYAGDDVANRIKTVGCGNHLEAVKIVLLVDQVYIVIGEHETKTYFLKWVM